VNATYQNGQLVHPNGVHIGIAVAVEQGLLVAVLRHCEGKSLRRIAQESQTLIQKAREGKLMPDEMMGNTFTVSNLGMFGIEQFTAIINPPASAILAVGATKRVPVVQEDGTIVARQRMKVTLSCDHRVLDGAVGAQFLQTLRQVLENPLWMV
jgi:pyruvate dehydrogenase E2 component (dihydrolipoamide acetyltransferase)